ADDHRLEFGVIDVGRNDGAAAGDFAADEFRGDEIGDGGAEGFALSYAYSFSPHVFADGDEFHLRRDDAAAGVLELGDGGAGVGATHAWLLREGRGEFFR